MIQLFVFLLKIWLKFAEKGKRRRCRWKFQAPEDRGVTRPIASKRSLDFSSAMYYCKPKSATSRKYGWMLGLTRKLHPVDFVPDRNRRKLGSLLRKVSHPRLGSILWSRSLTGNRGPADETTFPRRKNCECEIALGGAKWNIDFFTSADFWRIFDGPFYPTAWIKTVSRRWGKRPSFWHRRRFVTHLHP